MRLCIPVQENSGVESQTCSHFGSAPWFVIYDTETQAIEEISNTNEHHNHGQCNPFASLRDCGIDSMIIGGIGKRAFEKIQAEGISVYLADTGMSVRDVVALYNNRQLREVTPDDICSHHH
jgi:predicted Fe-Mo cluster-binding NifX family protein